MPDASQPPLPRGDADVQEPYEKRWLALGVIAMTVAFSMALAVHAG